MPTLEYTGPTAKISRGDPLTFAVRTAAPAGNVVVRVAGALQTDADGLLTGPDGTWLDEAATPDELGHMAGNKRHRARCANSPMIEALGAGEWWRGARAHWFENCSTIAHAAAAASATAPSRGALVRRVVRVD